MKENNDQIINNIVYTYYNKADKASDKKILQMKRRYAHRSHPTKCDNY